MNLSNHPPDGRHTLSVKMSNDPLQKIVSPVKVQSESNQSIKITVCVEGEKK